MSDDIDLYDDLPVLGFGESVCKIDEERQCFKKQLDEKEKDLHKVREWVSHLEKENKTLEENLSSLYKTAVNEIQRKNKVIEELRREKESLIFRRKRRQNHSVSSSVNIHTDGLDSNVHQTYLQTSGKKATEETIKSTISPCDSSASKRQIDRKYPSESTSNVAVVSRKSDGCFSAFSASSVPVQENNSDSYSKECGKTTKISQTNPVICENSCSKTSDILSEKSSCSSQTPLSDSHQKGSTGQSWELIESKHERQRRSLSSEDRREHRHTEKVYHSEKYCSVRSRHKSPLKRSKSSRFHDEDTRKDRSWNHNKSRKYHRDVNKETNFRGRKLNVGLDEELRRKHNVHSKRSPSPQWSRRSPVQRNSDRNHTSSKANRSIKPQSENVRLASQLKSKYSKAMRERSLSRTPVKHKLRSDLRSVQLHDVPQDAFHKLSVGENIGSILPVNKENVNESENSNSTVSNRHTSDTIKNKYSEIISKDPEKSSVNVVQCSAVKRKKCNSADIYQSCQIDGNVNTMKKETSKESNVVLEYNSGTQSENCSSSSRSTRISHSELFVTECENKSTRKEESFNGELQSQQMKTPPCRNLIPLKISPTFEDPAVVKENKFSLSVFNEQCEFRRPKRKRSVKLLITDIKNVCDTGDNKLETKRSNNHNGVHYNEGDAVTQTTVASKQINSSLGQSTSDEKVCSVNLQNVDLRNEAAWKNNNSLSEVHIMGSTIAKSVEVNQQKTILLSRDAYSSTDTKSNNNSKKLSEVEVFKNKSPNKKRKLDSICEELKANLEKKTFTNSVISTYNSASTLTDAGSISKCDMTCSEIVKSNQPLKHIIVSKRRRKQPNLQDNVVQVLSQVKSRIS